MITKRLIDSVSTHCGTKIYEDFSTSNGYSTPSDTKIPSKPRSKRVCVKPFPQNGLDNKSVRPPSKVSSLDGCQNESLSRSSKRRNSSLCDENFDFSDHFKGRPREDNKEYFVQEIENTPTRPRKLRRKSEIFCSSDEVQSSAKTNGETHFPSLSELSDAIADVNPNPLQSSSKIPKWLFPKFTPPAFRGLETIKEDHPSLRTRLVCRPRQRLRGGAVSGGHITSLSTSRTISTRKRPIPVDCDDVDDGGNGEDNQPEIPFWSKRPLPRRLSFGQWDGDLESLEQGTESTDKALLKFHETAAKRKSKRREIMLRQMNRKPGEMLKVSTETEQRFERFLKEMEEGEQVHHEV